MDNIQNDSWKLYPLGDNSLVPVGVDEERYSFRFVEHSRRLFASQGEHLEVMRVLSGSGGEDPCSQCCWTRQRWLILCREWVIFGWKRQCSRQTCKGEAEQCSQDSEEIHANLIHGARSTRAPPHKTHSSESRYLYRQSLQLIYFIVWFHKKTPGDHYESRLAH